MKCPKCDKELSKGILQTGNMIVFIKIKYKNSLNSKDPEDVMIYKKAMATSDFDGYICMD